MKNELLSNYIDYLGTPPPWSTNGAPRTRFITKWREFAFDTGPKFNNDLFHEGLDISKIPLEKIWVWSDQHFYHNNVIKYANRPFKDVDEMNKTLIKNAECIQPTDVCIWVGDVTFKSTEVTNNEILSKIPGYHILVIGNHDFQSRRIRPLNFDEVHVGYYWNLDNKNLFLTHYPIEDNEKLPDEVFNIHGHTHTNICNSPKLINVCVEQINYKPLNGVDLLNIIKERQEILTNEKL